MAMCNFSEDRSYAHARPTVPFYTVRLKKWCGFKS
jgi:hypothetical protein